MLRPAAAVTPTAASFAEPTVRPALAPTAARIVPAVNRSVASTPRVVPVAASTSSQCAGSDRAWRIAKPGAIGGLVGAATGAGYDCGTILGNRGLTDGVVSDRAPVTETALRPRAANDDITVYPTR
jgi:hypothetical protein